MDIHQEALFYAKEIFENESGGHDFHHTLRVYKMAMRLSKSEAADDVVVALAAILHDVDDYKLFGSKQGSTSNAEKFMRRMDCDEILIGKVKEIIATMSFKGKDSLPCVTLEGKIVQDADRLDAIGAIGIARAFAFGGNRQRIMHDPSIAPNLHMDQNAYVSNQGTTINHFHEKLFLLKDLMNTPSAQEIARRRHQYMLEFIREFDLEWKSDDIVENGKGGNSL
jgi:uncharacterized protein